MPLHRGSARLALRGAALVLFAAWVCVATPAAASDPETRALTVPGYPVTVQYVPGDERVADKVAALVGESTPRLAQELGIPEVGPFRILLIADMTAFRHAQPARLPRWGVAFALMENQIMLVDVKRASNSWKELERVIPHELSHLLLAQRVRGVRMPTWFVEGIAQWQAREWSLIENWRLMESVWTNRAPGLGQIQGALPADESGARDAYRVAYTAFVDRFDEQMDLVPAFLDQLVRSGDFSSAFETFWGESEFEFYGRFGRELQSKYRSRLLLFQTGPLFTIVAIVFLFVVIRIRLRNRRKLKRLEQIDRGLSLDDHSSDGP